MSIPFSFEIFTSLWLICSIIAATFCVATIIEERHNDDYQENMAVFVLAATLLTAVSALAGPIFIGLTMFDSYDKRTWS